MSTYLFSGDDYYAFDGNILKKVKQPSPAYHDLYACLKFYAKDNKPYPPMSYSVNGIKYSYNMDHINIYKKYKIVEILELSSYRQVSYRHEDLFGYIDRNKGGTLFRTNYNNVCGDMSIRTLGETWVYFKDRDEAFRHAMTGFNFHMYYDYKDLVRYADPE